ncbi:Lactosylceramide 4-alpha-galactosyltransferase [Gryllus bimaculatus]|nr:Lactosylceramide 4-alpha-galactosyltransferase [Gryllus bimaculatus]
MCHREDKVKETVLRCRAPACRRSARWPERACYSAEREPSPAELKLRGGARAAFAYPRRLLDVLDLRLPDEASIFFVDASCQGDTQLRLSARSACAVEAAARLNPRRTVILLATAAYGISADPQVHSSPPLPRAQPHCCLVQGAQTTAYRLQAMECQSLPKRTLTFKTEDHHERRTTKGL